MTPADIAEKLAEIAAVTAEGDHERARWLEGLCWRRVLEVIADGEPEPRALAMLALRTVEARTGRWAW